jgi:hypothetical protein
MPSANNAQNPPGKTGHPAILVMDSRNVNLAVRHQAQASMGWSRLYQAGPYYLDVSLKPGEKEARLVGQVVSQDPSKLAEGMVHLTQPSGLTTQALEPSGRFSFSITPDHTAQYSIEVELGGEKIYIERL